MIPIEATGHERRTEERLSIDLAATVRAYRLGPFAVRLVDASAGGAMVTLAGSLVARGDEVLVAASGIELVATIAWTTADYCGLAFHRRLSENELTGWRRAGRLRPGATP